MGFVPPPYPYDRLKELKALASAHDGGMVDLSIGTPFDPPPPEVTRELCRSGSERSYPPSNGTVEFREAAANWLNRLVGAGLDPDVVRATVGSKEFVAGLPHWLKLRTPERDTVLYPAVSYPSYAMGATLAGCRAVPVPVDDEWRIDVSAIDPSDIGRALCLWVNSPGNPAGGLDDLDALARWGRANDVVVASDECYIEFTWKGEPRSILSAGLQGVLAVHSLSKRSNLAGGRSGFFAGDPELVHYLGEVRKHSGLIQAGPVQAGAVVAFADDSHVEKQRMLYRGRMEVMERVLGAFGVDVPTPGGGFYLWVPAPAGDAWGFARRLAVEAGALVSPGEFYGQQGAGHIRIALVQPDDKLHLIGARLGLSC